MNEDKIIEILKELADTAFNNEEIDFNGEAARIEALYSDGVSEDIEHEAQLDAEKTMADARYGTLEFAAHKIGFMNGFKSHPTPEISEEEIKKAFYDWWTDKPLTVPLEVWQASCKWALSKAAKPVSEERMTELFDKHCKDDGYRLMHIWEFKAALKELNKS